MAAPSPSGTTFHGMHGVHYKISGSPSILPSIVLVCEQGFGGAGISFLSVITPAGRTGMAQQGSALIVAQALTKLYRMGSSEVVGVLDVDLEIFSGDLVALKGNSGSGKSTLLALLGGLDRPTRGRLTVGNQNLASAHPDGLTRYRRKTVGMVFQSFNLLPTLTAVENVCLPALLSGTGEAQARSRARELLEWLNLTHRATHLPAQLSGGEMQRTAIARALINDPSLILADEPTGNLDSRNGRIVVDLLKELNEVWHRTIIIATHSPVVDDCAHMIITLKDGRILEKVRRS